MKNKSNQLSRRNFIKNVGLAGTAFYIVPRHVLGGKGFIAPSDKLVIAGVGVGGKGEGDIYNFTRKGKADIAFLCDVDERMVVESRKRFPKAPLYKDYRVLFEKHSKSFDAVSVSTPDHMHAPIAMAAMQLGKHVYVQKPLSHDIYEARMMTEAAKKYQVVTQMGNQGASKSGVKMMKKWYDEGRIGEITEIYAFTDRPVWPQGVAWPNDKPLIPNELDWNLWLGSAPYKDYFDNLVPFNWRGWWNYGTGALGDMGCHNMQPAFALLDLGYPIAAECSIANRYSQPWVKIQHPESAPIASHITLTFLKNGKEVKLHWMDGGILPERPEKLDPNEKLGDQDNNGCIFIGTKGQMMCGTYGMFPVILPDKMNFETPKEDEQNDINHYTDWVDASIAGYQSKEANSLSSRFELAGPFTESVLMGNLAIRSYDIKEFDNKGNATYPGRNLKLLWDGPNMKITNFEPANQFVKRDYRTGFGW
ncbi:MAG: Gfo/Idh/MocA family oxidoreductase [Alphaproteobacteria bacterium]|nr:Gfo/Idh/MocA family oxidoreductase [Alphaproteobacteria bacterium]